MDNYLAFCKIHDYAVSRVKPGIRVGDVYEATSNFLAKKMP